jgi:hypothetical protein
MGFDYTSKIIFGWKINTKNAMEYMNAKQKCNNCTEYDMLCFCDTKSRGDVDLGDDIYLVFATPYKGSEDWSTCYISLNETDIEKQSVGDIIKLMDKTPLAKKWVLFFNRNENFSEPNIYHKCHVIG